MPLQASEHQSRVTAKQLFPDKFYTPTLRSSPISTSTGLYILDVAKYGHFEPKQKEKSMSLVLNVLPPCLSHMLPYTL